ncbi:nucleoside-triphosphatase [Streptomyces xantholiticus]|uniref:nucleoside-triphosphatase n=1 Tax=Streptomyces xantholiticus TaxID=68285 RepID=UPI001677DD20|nr:nucleoside-triphosphatase [Streptomyces xantholiticus]
MPTKILLEGRPGVGKTTVVRRLATLLHTREVVGFTTEEVRQGGARVGFVLETTTGHRAVLAHVDFPGPPKVGRYGVDLGVMDRLAMPGLLAASAEPVPGRLVLIDELGRMELYSASFSKAVRCVFETGIDVVATVHAHSDPFTDPLKRRTDVELVVVTRANRDTLPGRLAARLERR